MPNRRLEIAVTLRLAGLAAEPGELCLLRPAHVLEPGEIGLGGAELELGLVAAGIEPADPRRLFEQGAALLGAGADQGAHPVLADDRRGTRPGGEIGEQGLDVAGPHFTAIDTEGAARPAFEAAGDLEFGLFVEGGRSEALGPFEAQRDFGEIACRTRMASGEDDVVHLAAAQAARRALAHHPAQRIDHVRLAAAIGADDAGKAGADLKGDGFGEALEPADADGGEADAHAQRGLSSRPRRGTGRRRGREARPHVCARPG